MDDIESNGTWSRRVRLALIGFSVIGGVLLLAEHRAHVLPYLPWLLLAACPLMHVFMHRGHGHGNHAPGPEGGKDSRPGHQHGDSAS